MLQFMESQRIGYNLVTEQQQIVCFLLHNIGIKEMRVTKVHTDFIHFWSDCFASVTGIETVYTM